MGGDITEEKNNPLELLSWKDVRLIVSFFALFTIFYAVLVHVNSWEIRGVYRGETENGYYMIGSARIKAPFDLPEEAEGNYVIIRVHGLRMNVWGRAPRPWEIPWSDVLPSENLPPIENRENFMLHP